MRRRKRMMAELDRDIREHVERETKDNIGMRSQAVDWYQEHQPSLPCYFTVSQQMHIDGRTQDYTYTTNQLTFTIDSSEIFSEVQPDSGGAVEGCEYYSGSKVAKRSCKP